MEKKARSFLTVCAIVISMTVMAVPVSGLLGALEKASAAPAVEEHTLRIGFMQTVDSLNPYVGYSDSAYVFYGLVYDALEVINNTMQPVPDLALSCYAVNNKTDPLMIASGEPYGSVWQYNLTDKAYFSDGEPVTADDVIFAVNLNAGNYTNMWAYQPYSYYMQFADQPFPSDPYKIRIHFFDRATGKPAPAAYAYIISIPILPKHKLIGMTPLEIGFSWKGVFEDATAADGVTKTGTVGTGPFMGTSTLYDDWFRGEEITLVKNPLSHWSVDFGMNVSVDKVQLVFYDDPAAMALSLRNGDIDVASFPPQAYTTLRDDVKSGKLKNVETYDGPKITQYWTEVGFNMNAAGPHPSRLDPKIREALAMSTNKDYIVSQFYLGLAEPGSTIIPPFNKYWHYNLTAAETYNYDIEAAKALLASAGYVDTNSDGYREATSSSRAVTEGWALEGDQLAYSMMVRREYPEEKQIAQYLQQEWAKVGVNLAVDIVDEVQLNTEVYYYQYDTMLWYWSADIDPNYQLFVQTKAAWGGWSDNKYYNESYDQNYTKSVQSMNPADRKVYVDNCQRINYRDAGYILLAYVNQSFAWRTDSWSGWGDWAQNPGRSIDNFWMGNPLWFDLTPVEKAPQKPLPWALIGAGIAGVVVAIVAVAYLTKKGKIKRKESDDSPIGD